ncbi:MAG: hypothetical protein QXK89_02535 [Candidatus Bathyarchaeia archaeon]
MKVLLINLCADPLSELEFVRPMEQILNKIGANLLIKRYTEVNLKEADSAEKVIICGSALKDNKFLSGEWFSWLKACNTPILGVGSGFHVIAKIFDCNLFDKTKIGVYKVRVIRENKLVDKKDFQAYLLTRRVAKVTKPLEPLAMVKALECMVKHESKEIYGCLFHPEVMNQNIITNFALKI